MPIAHIRDLAKYGVVPDLDPYVMPVQAFSMGVNCRFRNNKVTRGPVYRVVKTLGQANPRFAAGNPKLSGIEELLVGYQSGRIYLVTPASETNVSLSGYVDSPVEAQWTYTSLADVAYVNREDRVPWYFGSADTAFSEIPAWDSGWRCHLLRTCGGALVALNITKGAVETPTMIKTSSIPLAGDAPASWDETDPATNATENILAEMRGPIVDATSLGQSLIIYGQHESWLMQPVGGLDLYQYTKLPFGKGAIGANCSVEVGSQHYVMGPDDIWMHDGVSEVSICEGTTREFIFDNMNASLSTNFFVNHNAKLKEIEFHYVSNDAYVFFNSNSACNRKAVYNYVNKTWTFDDVPLIYSAARANIDTTDSTYDTIPGTYDTTGTTYADQDDGSKKSVVAVGDTSSTYGLTGSLYAFDLYTRGSSIPAPVEPAANPPMYLERTGLDLDEIQEDLKNYKLADTVWPQARLGVDTAPLQFAFGAADYFGLDPTWGSYDDYDRTTQYKFNPNIAGRYLAFRILYEDYKDVSISGFDINLEHTGEE